MLLLFSCTLVSAKGRNSNSNKETLESNENSVTGIIEESNKESQKKIKLAIERTEIYLDTLRNKRVGVVSNQTGVIGKTHLVDTLLSSGINVVKVFAPEHGFRGKVGAGEHFSSTVDFKTGLPIMSLYGKTKKPSVEMMEGVDIMIFDIQDVGVRFYTFISTLHYVMEACAEANIPLVVLDRPNPNCNYVDGPVLDTNFRSFVGMHPVPIVYGMTIGEYGEMINGEKWLANGIECNLTVIPMANYTRKSIYKLPIPPSPNLRTNTSIYLYPSLCFFEGTSVSVGRGTDTPFEIYGHPDFPETDFAFTPVSQEGATHPLWENTNCVGYNLVDDVNKRPTKLNLNYFINAYNLLKDKEFVTNQRFLNLLVGNNQLMDQLNAGLTQKEIRASWQTELVEFKIVRAKYLFY
ncbi:MAG: exo-beta-N-acetylmuramidase NamZ family protein [Bacteroidota bacterium]